MLEQVGHIVRRLSLLLVAVGLLVAFYTEGFSNIPVGRGGRPKPPIAQQRLTYLLVLGAGVPGVAWGVIRAVKGQQRTPWE